ncbi:MAG: 3-hydroxyacyl-ACP dehydratase FabZ [Candidatus Wallbacteria bacterium]|nr:3-hydroxyacyl-ACP dehydratase FabZ [Candidatus Wallbacteria bacterium]
MVPGKGDVAICNACIDLASQVLAREEVAPPPSPADTDVLAAIPHRPPFLFVDRILECTPQKLRAERTVRDTEPQFRGHYPGKPLMPGVLLCEAVIQCGAILVARLHSQAPEGVPVLTRIQDARFKKMVVPGDTVTLEAELVEQLQNAFFMKGRATVGGQKALTIEFAVTLAPQTAAD